MKMIDALYPDSIPAGTTCDAIAAYIDHRANLQSFQQAVAKFPDAVHVKISATAPGTVGADVLDVEPGTYITVQQAIAWVKESRAKGLDPTVYCNQHDTQWGWPALRTAFASAGVPEPHWWVANYDGDPTIPAGASAKQYTDRDQYGRNTYDTSSTAPGWMENDMTPEQLITALNSDAGQAALLNAVKPLFRDDAGSQYRVETLVGEALAKVLNPTALAAAIAKQLPGVQPAAIQSAVEAGVRQVFADAAAGQ